jgi:rhodanese-related sulfurtransferase
MNAPTLREWDAATLKAKLDRGEAVLIDCREAGEFAREHVAGAKLVPLSTLDATRLDLPAGKSIVVMCASGTRSARAAAQLLAAGRGDVAHLKGGLPTWRAAGYPVIEDKRAPLPIMRQVQMVAGGLVVLGVALGASVHPLFHALAAFVGAGLFVAGATGWCGMATLLAQLPYNKRASA